MSSEGMRERSIPHYVDVPNITAKPGDFVGATSTLVGTGKQFTVSTSNRKDPRTGHYRSGGGFYTSKVDRVIKFGHLERGWSQTLGKYYSGPVLCAPPSSTEMENIGYKNISQKYGDKMESQMTADGTTAISLCNPVNPASDLGTTMSESFREGVPSLPGIKSWKDRTRPLVAAGSEFLNAEFGWLPLVKEVHDVVKVARHHRDVMQQYHHGEGRDTHRRFDYPSDTYHTSSIGGSPIVRAIGPPGTSFESGLPQVVSERQISLTRETKRWFEGCFTYGLPSSTPSWGKAMGFGSDADQLFGLALSPSILWELTPWSWAVDWFSNTGEVINNITNFGLAGLVMRYGYMMTETVETVTAEVGPFAFLGKDGNGKVVNNYSSPAAHGYTSVTKRRSVASPFGFSIGWEGLSPTQLAITAALGITRWL